MKVLLVATDAAVLAPLREVFETHGHTLREVGDPQAASARSGERFVLVDLALGQPAITLLEHLGRMGPRPYVLALTREASPAAVRDAMAAGVDDYLVVPCSAPAIKLRMAIAERHLAQRVAAHDRVDTANKRVRTLLETTNDGLFQVDAEGRIELCNSRFAELVGFADHELVGQIADRLLVSDDMRALLPGGTLLGTGTGSEQYALPLLTKDGGKRWVSLTAAPIPNEGGGSRSVLGVAQDLTLERKTARALERERAFFQQLFRTAPTGIVILDDGNRVIDANAPFVEMFQFPVEELEGHELTARIVPETVIGEAEALWRAVAAGETTSLESVRKRRNGSEIDVSILAFPIVLGGRQIGAYGMYDDISDRKAAERRLYHDASHDALTGLPNRALLRERVELAARRVDRDGKPLALLFLDLDGFKDINDRFGHASGDHVLIETARRISACLRPGDTVARLGGDELAIVLESLDQPVAEATRLAEQVLAAVRTPLPLPEGDVTVTASIGIVVREDERNLDELLRDADIAMYRAKAGGKDRFAMFDPTQHASAARYLRAERELGRAVEQGELSLDFQPLVSLVTGRLVAFEALVRWDHPERGRLAPAEVLPAAEEARLMVPLGDWVCRQACAQLASWHRDFPTHDELLVHINVAASELADEGFLSRLDAALRAHALHPASLALELTSTLTAQPREPLEATLWSLDERGIRLVVDDVGPGTLSIDSLERLPLEALKIDRSLVARLRPGGRSLQLMRTIVAIADTLGLTVIAEGVESDDQIALLSSAQVRRAQGFAFAQPLGVDDATALLERDPTW